MTGADRSGGGWQARDADLLTERAKGFVGPTLRGRHVHLRAVIPDDYTYLQLVETSSDLAPQWRLRGSTPGPQDWMQYSLSGALAQFVVIANGDQARVGLVAAFQDSLQDGHARVAAMSFNPRSRSPLMMLGFGLFVDYVFRCWNLRKLYMHVPEYNYATFASGRDRYFTLEGCLRQHYYLDGDLWDQFILAIYRDAWREQAGPLLRGEQLA